MRRTGTFLAWVRTAIAVMQFGFLIVKFDIFLATMAGGMSSPRPALHGQRFANEAGLVFILLGVAMTIVATVRFFRIARQIDKAETVPSSGSVFDLVLAALPSVFLCFFISRVRFCRGSDRACPLSEVADITFCAALLLS